MRKVQVYKSVKGETAKPDGAPINIPDMPVDAARKKARELALKRGVKILCTSVLVDGSIQVVVAAEERRPDSKLTGGRPGYTP